MKKKLTHLAALAFPVVGLLLLLATMAWGRSSEEEDEGEEGYIGVINADMTHTEENPFCVDDSCDCHTNPAEIENVKQYIADGEMTEAEATQYYYGKNV
jgi:hypothetical protein